MTRDDVLQIFAEANDEQLEALLQLHAADVVEAGAQAQRQLEQREQQQALETRFDAAAGGRKFVHDIVRREVLREFVQQRMDPANEALGDGELLEKLTADSGCFAPQHQPVMMADMGDIAVEDMEKLSDAEYYAAVRRRRAR